MKFDDLKKEREQRMKANERPWWEKLADAFVAQYDAQAQAYQGGFSLIGDGLEYPQRQLKKNISGDEESWGLPDFSYVGPVGKSGERTATYTDEGAETMMDFVVDPVAPIVGGVGLAAKGIRTAHRLAGPKSLKGNTLSAPSNYIDNWYAPSGTAQPNVVDELIMQNQESLSGVPKVGPVISKLEKPQDSADMRERVGSFAGWGVDSGVRAIKQTVSPSARANYRENQVTQTMQDTARTALRTGKSRDEGKAIAQAQATENISNQGGRNGDKLEAVEDLNRRSFLTEPVKATEGSYRKLIKDNKLTGVYEKSGKPVGVSDKDLGVVEDHVLSVWKDRKGKRVSETPTADIRIKNPGSGDQVTGAHVLDFRQKSKVFKTMNSLYKKNPKPTLEETWRHLKDSDVKLHPKSQTLEDARENGIWVTGSFSGTAITEGGVNYIAKVNPNGRVMAVISDEHNFLENVPVIGPVVDAALPNRSISVTPPMFFDINKTKGKINAPQPQDKKNVKESLFDIATAKPSDEMLRAERQVNSGAAIATTGLLTGVGVRRDEN
jgi:hypothetical protein